MPIQACELNGKPGYQWGHGGKCYTYNPRDEASRKRARRKCHIQGFAIESSKSRMSRGEHMKESVKLLESSISPAALRVDEESCTIFGVKVLGRLSRNNREYSPAALESARRLTEGMRVNVDHVEKGARRSYRDRLGVLKAARLQEDGVYADLHYNPKHDLAEQLVWDAQHAPTSLGLSIDAEGRTRTAKGKTLVESVDKVRSVDLVADPASVASLYESADTEEEPMSLENLTLDQIRAARPDLLTELVESLEESSSRKAREQELTQLREELATLRAEKAKTELRANILQQLQEAKLDVANKKHVSEAFLTTLLEAKDDAARKALIDDRKSLVESAPAAPHTASRFVTPTADGATLADRVRSWTSKV